MLVCQEADGGGSRWWMTACEQVQTPTALPSGRQAVVDGGGGWAHTSFALVYQKAEGVGSWWSASARKREGVMADDRGGRPRTVLVVGTGHRRGLQRLSASV